jgi:hypothetical protein
MTLTSISWRLASGSWCSSVTPTLTIHFELRPESAAALRRPVNGTGGFQSLLRTLQSQLSPTNTLTLAPELAGRIDAYVHSYGDGGFHGRLNTALCERDRPSACLRPMARRPCREPATAEGLSRWPGSALGRSATLATKSLAGAGRETEVNSGTWSPRNCCPQTTKAASRRPQLDLLLGVLVAGAGFEPATFGL